MKKENQIEFNKSLGDCFRACVASILEFPITEMPNFWEQTQDSLEYWKLTNDWLSKLGYKCIVVNILDDCKCYIDGLLCIALGKNKKNKEEHAVVWQDGLRHDPYPDGNGLFCEPNTFAILTLKTPITIGDKLTHRR